MFTSFSSTASLILEHLSDISIHHEKTIEHAAKIQFSSSVGGIYINNFILFLVTDANVAMHSQVVIISWGHVKAYISKGQTKSCFLSFMSNTFRFKK